MASVNRPRDCIAEVADDSTIVWRRGCVLVWQVLRVVELVMMTKEMDDAEEDDDAEMKDC